jgi:hypothetical protein
MVMREMSLDLLLIVLSVFGFLFLKGLLLPNGSKPQHPGRPLRGGFTRGP